MFPGLFPRKSLLKKRAFESLCKIYYILLVFMSSLRESNAFESLCFGYFLFTRMALIAASSGKQEDEKAINDMLEGHRNLINVEGPDYENHPAAYRL